MLGVSAGFIRRLKNAWDCILSSCRQEGDRVRMAACCFVTVGSSVPVSARPGGYNSLAPVAPLSRLRVPAAELAPCTPAARQPECLAFAWQDTHYRCLIEALGFQIPAGAQGLGSKAYKCRRVLKANLIWNCRGRNAHGGSCKTYPQSWAAFEHKLVRSEVAFISRNGLSNL